MEGMESISVVEFFSLNAISPSLWFSLMQRLITSSLEKDLNCSFKSFCQFVKSSIMSSNPPLIELTTEAW